MRRCRISGAIAVSLLASTVPVHAHQELDELRTCLGEADDAKRLACFDREVRKLVKPTFEGRLNVVTDPFTITKPTTLRFQSDGVIFVLYVKTGNDEVVQNLHIGGGGEGTYIISNPGTYFLQINGSENWRIWLDPDPNGAPQNAQTKLKESN